MTDITVPKQMEAAVVKDFNQGYEVRKIDVPSDLGPNDILVKIGAAGYCHTDLQVLEGVYESAGAKPGLVGSHEPAGTVVKVGNNANRNGIRTGDRVGSINTYQFCGECEACRKQGEQLCERMAGMLGLTVNGGFSEYMKADSRVVSKIPESISFAEAAPLFCAGATVYGALLRADPEPGQWLAIVGVGGLGHLGIQYAKAMGLKVVAIDNRREGIDTALEGIPSHLRPDRTYVVDSEEAQQRCIDDLSSPDKGSPYKSNPGIDRVVIATEARHLVSFSQQFLRKGGVIVDIGLPADGPLEVDSFALNFKEHSIRGRLICTPQQCQDMINLHAEHGCKTYIEKTYPVSGINDMFERYKSKDLRGRLCMVF
ncbi:alcohol dehydrogenase, propanol-preferring [Geosmithia morbida]|uniref:Alcohol dehydrogenase, propanol-preferring n=1 Tax=Geosmithia morbida TaxID=1094350 RepID=A0A9P4YMA4_9HYPO|nr:alcohol dehydrogenase, propanol-preferring [Geosmithia morbida]XP_035318890.1 alcohol dehydrogenase, propanol-preferring [Geosmithia morbida]KAF4119586.1 alcohol dehydrogenase, propanol-preferring [Geosmithia morbida]KAF4120238.1 alcohol dehydrogenase, propanol-preferring [Geosmithia morbida]